MRIKDLALMPYEIEVLPEQSILYKIGENQKGERKEEVMGYFSASTNGMESLIKKIVRDRVIDTAQVLTLEKFLTEWNKQTKMFTDLLTKVLGKN